MRFWTSFLCVLFLGVGGLRAETQAPDSFFRAIVAGDVATVTRDLDSGVSPDSFNRDEFNALYLACDKGQPKVAELLIARGADVNLTPPSGSTALQVAIYRGFDSYKLKPKAGFPELYRALLAKGAEVNTSDVNGNTPLIAAAEKDDVATLKLLLEHGAKMGHANENGWTALDLALMQRRRTIAHEMVKLGAPLDAEQQKSFDRYKFARATGMAFPIIVVGSFVLAFVMHQRLVALPKRTAAPGAGDDLPKLQPLKCASCGGSASLRPGVAKCSHCHQPVPVPEDYTETLKLRSQSFKLMAKAERLWKRIRLVSMPPVQIVLWIAALVFVWFMWQGLFPLFVREALYNLMTFFGTLVWAWDVLALVAIAIAIAGYAIYLAVVRSELPAAPAAAKAVGGEEDMECANCGGMVEIGAGHVVGICGYCGSETYRVALARKARAAAAEQKDVAATSLYTAMVRIYEMRENAALAVPIAIVVIGMCLVFLLRVALMFL
jgi:Zn finger protein HypA/HybF involved in hydrogenase expression